MGVSSGNIVSFEFIVISDAKDFKCSSHQLNTHTVVIFLKATKGKSQIRISLKQQRFLKNDKSESFLDFYLVYKYVYLKVMR